jgi:hypothetical protein
MAIEVWAPNDLFQMKSLRITVGGALERDATRRFVDAWHRAGLGARFRECHLAFESRDRLRQQIVHLDLEDEREALEWIEAVSEFDNEPGD